MSRFPVSRTKTNRQPPVAAADTTNIWCIGDTHFAEPDYPWQERVTICKDDLNSFASKSLVDAIVQLGDQTTNASTNEFNAYLSWKAAFTYTVPFAEVIGNHDLIGNNASGTPDLVTPSQWATIMSRAGKDIYIDVGDSLRLLLVSPAEDATTGEANVRRLTLDPSTLTWCDQRMDETTRKCLLFFHAPLMNTVGPLDGSAFSSYDERWYAHNDVSYTIDSMIAKHSNFIAWVSGHTHSRIDEVDLVKQVTYGGVSFAAISTGSPAFWNPSGGAKTDPVISCMVSVSPTEILVRYRDHGMRQWLDPVYSVALV